MTDTRLPEIRQHQAVQGVPDPALPDDVRARLAAIAADEGRGEADRETARSFLPFLGDDDPGAATDVPRSRVEQCPPPTYDLSDESNTP